MPSAFDEIMASHLDPVVDETYAVGITIRPMIAVPNGRSQPDTSRRVIECEAPFFYDAIEFGIELGVRKSYKEANDFRILQSGREPLIMIDLKYFPTPEDEPRQGDIVEIEGLGPENRFQVTKSNREGLSRITLGLVKGGGQV